MSELAHNDNSLRQSEWSATGNARGGELLVDTGEVEVCRGDQGIKANALGSCVAVTAFDPESGVAGMAHVMLPGISPDQDPSKRTRYAQDAIDEMLRKSTELGADVAKLQVCLVGGVNVLGEGHVSPGPGIVDSVTDILGKMGISPVASDVGGEQR